MHYKKFNGFECGGHGTKALPRLASAHITHTRTDKMTDTRKANAGVIFKNEYGSRTSSTAWPVGRIPRPLHSSDESSIYTLAGAFQSPLVRELSARWLIDKRHSQSLSERRFPTPPQAQQVARRHHDHWQLQLVLYSLQPEFEARRKCGRCSDSLAAIAATAGVCKKATMQLEAEATDLTGAAAFAATDAAARARR